MTARRVLLTAAPGGHSGYAAAIAHYLRASGVEPVFIIARGDGWTRGKLSRLGSVVEATMPRRPGEPLLRTLHRWPRALVDSLRVVGVCRVLVSCGGNLSVMPALVAHYLQRMKVLNVESIVRIVEPGKTPALLSRIADITIVHWEEQARLFPHARRVEVVGPIYEPPRYKPWRGDYVLVTAGTTGYPELFEAISRLGLERVVLQTGRVDPEPYKRRHPGWKVFRFDPDIDRWIAGARVVVTHFPGMTSATAALAYGKPVVLVATPHLRLSASRENGPLYAEKIGAVYLEKPEPERLRRALEEAEASTPPRYDNGGREAARLVVEMMEDTEDKQALG